MALPCPSVPNKLLEAFPELPPAAWRVYQLLSADGSLATARLAAELVVTDRMVRKYITLLKERGLLLRIGSNKTGRWRVNR